MREVGPGILFKDGFVVGLFIDCDGIEAGPPAGGVGPLKAGKEGDVGRIDDGRAEGILKDCDAGPLNPFNEFGPLKPGLEKPGSEFVPKGLFKEGGPALLIGWGGTEGDFPVADGILFLLD